MGNTMPTHFMDVSMETALEYKNIEEEFRYLMSLEAKIRYIRARKAILNFWDVVRDVKDDALSEKIRVEGNKEYSKRNDLLALQFYNRSIKHAEYNSSNLASAYGNRSAVLFRKKYYKECLQDIKRVFDIGCSKDVKIRLTNRKKQAAKLLASQVKQQYCEPVPLMDESEKNKLIECAVNCIKIGNTESMGRGIFATRDIEAGELLAVENPFMIEETSEDGLHCSECLDLCYNMVPCLDCTEMMYCTDHCRKIAWNKYHKFECQFVKLIHSLHPDMLIALRMTIVAKNQYQKLSKMTLEGKSVYRSDRFWEIYHLQRHEDDTNLLELFVCIKAAIFLSDLLEHNSCLFSEVKLPNAKLIFEIFLVQNILRIQVNGHQLMKFDNTQIMNLGTGIFSFLSLLNHSCNPNVYRVNHGKSMVLRALRNIEKEDQLFDTYRYTYADAPRYERQCFTSSNYRFVCICEACQEDWPIKYFLPVNDITMVNETEKWINKISRNGIKYAKSQMNKVVAAARNLHQQPSYDSYSIVRLLALTLNSFGNKHIAF